MSLNLCKGASPQYHQGNRQAQKSSRGAGIWNFVNVPGVAGSTVVVVVGDGMGAAGQCHSQQSGEDVFFHNPKDGASRSKEARCMPTLRGFPRLLDY
jgi:hypothetical protein